MPSPRPADQVSGSFRAPSPRTIPPRSFAAPRAIPAAAPTRAPATAKPSRFPPSKIPAAQSRPSAAPPVNSPPAPATSPDENPSPSSAASLSVTPPTPPPTPPPQPPPHPNGYGLLHPGSPCVLLSSCPCSLCSFSVSSLFKKRYHATRKVPQIQPKLRLLRRKRSISRHIPPPVQCAHVRLHMPLQQRQRNCRDTPNAQ